MSQEKRPQSPIHQRPSHGTGIATDKGLPPARNPPPMPSVKPPKPGN
jgi:hypothetical protein